MKVCCHKCGARLKAEICKKCGSDNSLYYRTEKFSRPSRLGLIISLVTAVTVIVGFLASCISCIACPEVWSVSSKENRVAILEYAKENYPQAKIVAEYYPSAQFNPTNKPYDAIWFELDGINFYIQARDGIVDSTGDGYGMALLESEVHEKYISNFFLQQGLSYDADISFYDYYPYWPQKNASLNTFPGRIKLDFRLDLESNKQTLQNIDWFYDFYCYWKEVCPTKGFILRFHYWGNDQIKYLIYCDSISEFDSKEEFYSASERLPV